MTLPIHLIGAGRAGSAMAAALSHAGYPLDRVMSRSRASAAALCDRLGQGTVVTDPADAIQSNSITLVAVPDRELPSLATQAAAGKPLDSAVALHLSGAASSEALAPLRNRRVAVGSLHPAYAFADRDQGRPDLSGVCFGVQGDAAAVAAATELTQALGGRLLALTEQTKPLHHAACVLASNGLVALLSTAFELEERAGADPDWGGASLRPLVEGTLQNIERLGPAAALTGPVERGDHASLEQHRQALQESAPEALDLYRELARVTVRLALAKGTLNEEQAMRIRQLLDLPA